MRSGGSLPRRALAAGLLLTLVAGCRPSGSGVLAASAADLAPDARPGDRATLRLGTGSATEFEVGLRQRKEDGTVALDLTSNGESLEQEAYESTGSAFRVVLAGVDRFVPGIDLVRYPVQDGGSWDWDGKVAYAGTSRTAHGRISVRKDGEDVRSDVSLSITVDPGRPGVERRMTFWFRKGHGVVRRAFGDVSSRRPVGEAWRP